MPKNYLNAQEVNEFLMIGFLEDSFRRIIEDWGSRETITKEELKNIKTAKTFLAKFYGGVMNRLDKKEVDKLLKRLKKFEFRFLDDYTTKRLLGQFEEEHKVVKMPRVEFEDWCEQMMTVKCLDCHKKWTKCKLHDLLKDNFVPESSWGLKSCRYAYRKTEKGACAR